jgi:NAD(P)-dependent dehydrogenase (short-subunit alcohol dehydrogenase family)
VRDLAGRVAVVTGGASGIGRALAERLLAEGVRVVVADVAEDALDATVGELAGGGGDVRGRRCDVADAGEVEALARWAVEECGAVHIVCNNAGVSGSGGPIATIPAEEWDRVLGVNLGGVINGVRAFLPLLLEQGEGHIVNTASVMGLIPSHRTAPYTVSKYGVVALSETLYLELTPHPKVNVSVLCPSWVATNIVAHDSAGDDDARARRVRKALAERGADPRDIADLAVAAIRGNRFYVLNHDGNDRLIRHRTAAILDGLPPFFDDLR